MSTPGERKFSQKLMGLETCNLPMGFKFYAKHSSRKESPDSGGKPGTVTSGTCDSRGVGGVGVLVNTSIAKNIDSLEQLTTRIGRLRMRRCGPTPALTIFVAYAPTSSYKEEEVEAFYMDLENSTPKTIINWDLFATLAGFWEDSAMDNIERNTTGLLDTFTTVQRRLRVLKPPRDACLLKLLS
ncbi:hypothetical protein NECAME_16008 [Necator americanus]|uniref:Uncharacterized protein n=1 Tax=Necator americanus TaxID=51031 RepID=W2TYQ1_NECAM|nr:hypothetical protein NECAME_16008 [Necator americanus]ETN86983.1 hypothetical protein NECAME_16008 [Necator americanus]